MSRPPAGAGTGCFGEDVPLELHTDRQSVSADRRADSAGPAPLRIPGGSGRAASAPRWKYSRSTKWSASIRRSHELITFEPFYSYRHAALRDKQQTFWLAHRRPSARRNDEGTEITISLVDLSARPVRPGPGHADGAHHLHQSRSARRGCLSATRRGDFELEGGAPIKRIVALTQAHCDRAAAGRQRRACGADFASFAELSVAGGEGREALQEILRLYNFTGSAYSEKQIDGILERDEQAAFRARRVGERHRVRARHARRNGARRRAVRGQRRVPVRQRAGSISGAVCFAEQLQPVGRAHAAAKGGSASNGRRERDRRSCCRPPTVAESLRSTLLRKTPQEFQFFQACACWSGCIRTASRWARFVSPVEGSRALSAPSRRCRFRPARFSRCEWPEAREPAHGGQLHGPERALRACCRSTTPS